MVDPLDRINTGEMFDHPWLMLAADELKEEVDQSGVDEEALSRIEISLGHSRKTVLEAIRDEEISDVTASYILLSTANKKRE